MKTPADGWDPEEREAFRELEPELEVIRRRHPTDPPLDLLQAARADVLPDDLQQAAERHLANDRWARTLTDDLASMDAAFSPEDEDRLLQRTRHARRERSRRNAWTWASRPALAFATIALVVGSVLSVRYATRRTPVPAPAAVSGPAESTAPVAQTFTLPLEKPAVRLSVAALTWRGSGNEASLAMVLRPGLDAFRDGDYATADRELARAAAAFPDAVDPVFYQGVSRLFVDDVPGALASLSVAQRLADASLRTEVTWYLAIAEARAGRIAEARAHVMSVCQSASERAAQACAALEQMP